MFPTPNGLCLLRFEMLDQRAAGFGAGAAGTGAFHHVRFLRELLAGISALIARLRARLTCRNGKRALTGADTGRGRTNIAAIQTEIHARNVILIAFCNPFHTVPEAGFAGGLTGGAGFRTFEEVRAVCAVILLRRGIRVERDSRKRGGASGNGSQNREYFAAIHGSFLLKIIRIKMVSFLPL
jgi:hypothetical protein